MTSLGFEMTEGKSSRDARGDADIGTACATCGKDFKFPTSGRDDVAGDRGLNVLLLHE